MCQNSRQEWLFVPKENSPWICNPISIPFFFPVGMPTNAESWSAQDEVIFISYSAMWAAVPLPRWPRWWQCRLCGQGPSCSCRNLLFSIPLNASRGPAEPWSLLWSISGKIPVIHDCGHSTSHLIPPAFVAPSLLSKFFLCHCVMISSKNLLIEDSNARKKE